MRYWFPGAAMAGLVCGLVALAVPPLHTLTHEFSTLFAIVTAPALFFCMYALARRVVPVKPHLREANDALLGVWWAGAGIAAVLAVSALVVLALGNAFWYRCQIWAGLPYFMTAWGPAALFTNTAGVTLGALDVRKRVAVFAFAAFAAALLAHDMLQLYFGPRIFPIDPLIGALDAFTQRASQELSQVHILNRLFLLCAAWLIWELGRWRVALRYTRQPAMAEHYASGARGQATVLAILLALAATIGGSYLGIGFGRANLHNEYKLADQTEHFEVRFADDPETLAVLDAIKRRAEWEYRYLTARWEAEPSGRIRLYVIKNGRDLQKYTGFPNPHAGIREVFIDTQSALTPALRHELAHALHSSLSRNPLLLLDRGMLEGTATAFADRYAEVPGAHEMQAAAMRHGFLPAPSAFMGLGGFSRGSEYAAYESAGSFLGFLFLEYGVEPFKTVQRKLDFEEAYGRNVGELESEWRGFLERVPISGEALLLADARFHPQRNPGYTELRCPKVGPRPADAILRAEYAAQTGDFATAAGLYRKLWETGQGGEWLRESLDNLLRSGAHEEALTFLREAQIAPGLTASERWWVDAETRRLLAVTRRWEELYAAYDSMRAEGQALPFSLRMLVACVRNPYIRDYYAEILTETNSVVREQLWLEAMNRWSDFYPLRFVYAQTGLSPAAPVAARAELLMELAEHSGEAADALAPLLIDLYNDAMDARAYIVAHETCITLQRHCNNDRYRFEGQLGIERLNFERPQSLSSNQ